MARLIITLLVFVSLLSSALPSVAANSLFRVTTDAGPTPYTCLGEFRKMFKRTPSTAEWEVKIEPSCAVINQLGAPTCALESGMEVLTSHYRSTGLISEKAQLSSDYYYANALKEMLESGTSFMNWKGLGPEEIEEKWLRKLGLVTTDAYRLPRVRGRTIRSISRSELDQLALADKTAFIEEYLHLEKVSPVTVHPDTPKSKLHIFGRDQHPEIESALDLIKKELDRGRQIFSIWEIKGTSMSNSNFSELVKTGAPESFPRKNHKKSLGFHAMVVTGYKLDHQGKIKMLLIKNSWGLTFHRS